MKTKQKFQVIHVEDPILRFTFSIQKGGDPIEFANQFTAFAQVNHIHPGEVVGCEGFVLQNDAAPYFIGVWFSDGVTTRTIIHESVHVAMQVAKVLKIDAMEAEEFLARYTDFVASSILEGMQMKDVKDLTGLNPNDPGKIDVPIKLDRYKSRILIHLDEENPVSGDKALEWMRSNPNSFLFDKPQGALFGELCALKYDPDLNRYMQTFAPSKGWDTLIIADWNFTGTATFYKEKK